MYNIELSEEQRQLLLILVRVELLNPNTQDTEEIGTLKELEELLD